MNSERGDQQEGRREIGADVRKKGARDKGQRGTRGDSGQLHVAWAEHMARWKKAKMTDGTKKGRICEVEAEICKMTPVDVSETHLEHVKGMAWEFEGLRRDHVVVEHVKTF